MVTATVPDATLTALLREFAGMDAARACAEPAGAYANCLALSVRCARWLRERDVACGLVHLSGSRELFPAGAGRWPFYEPAQIEHWTVGAGDWSIDWTARQFRAGAEWPAVARVDALAGSWERVDDWACKRCPELVSDERHQELAPAGLAEEHRELARARAAGASERFHDPRHDGTAPLIRLCACPPRPEEGQSRPM